MLGAGRCPAAFWIPSLGGFGGATDHIRCLCGPVMVIYIIYIYIYVYTYVYMYVYIYIHTYISLIGVRTKGGEC